MNASAWMDEADDAVEKVDAVEAIWLAFMEHGLLDIYTGPEAEYYVESEKQIREKIKMVIDEEVKRAVTIAYALHTATVESGGAHPMGLFQQQTSIPNDYDLQRSYVNPRWTLGPGPRKAVDGVDGVVFGHFEVAYGPEAVAKLPRGTVRMTDEEREAFEREIEQMGCTGETSSAPPTDPDH